MMDREQFTSAVLAAEPTLYRVAKTMLRSEYDCADAAQQAILRAWEQLDSRRLRLMITATCMPPSPHWRKSCACRWSCTT